MNISVIGRGSWGEALSSLLIENGHSVKSWRRGLDMETELEGSEAFVFAVPSQYFREVLEKASPFIPEKAIVINAAKGIEIGSHKRLSEIASELRPDFRYVALSGPSHSEEVIIKMPTMITAASLDKEAALITQDIFMNDYFRVYTNHDLKGVELGGALKNVIAVVTGIMDGLGYGDNTRAAMMTRGHTEIMRLGVKLGADSHTFAGRSGMGDLIVTCGSMHSRNRRCGVLIGQGKSPKEAEAEIGMEVEGIYTAVAARELATDFCVDMPMTTALCKIIDGKLSPADAAQSLMTRTRKHENEDIFR